MIEFVFTSPFYQLVSYTIKHSKNHIVIVSSAEDLGASISLI